MRRMEGAPADLATPPHHSEGGARAPHQGRIAGRAVIRERNPHLAADGTSKSSRKSEMSEELDMTVLVSGHTGEEARADGSMPRLVC
jgi:hypothetical protein